MFSNEPAIRDDGAHVVVTLRGELDIANAADLGAVLSEAVARNPHVIADLSDLTFIDCASLGVLVRARTRAREAGGDLVLAGARGRSPATSSASARPTRAPSRSGAISPPPGKVVYQNDLPAHPVCAFDGKGARAAAV